jgi:uncharacterized membrane protein YbaN (DUF454 family)
MNSVARALRYAGPVRIDLQIPALKALGTTFFALGTVGLVLPLVPTTELWMVAAYCYAKSAPELAERLFAHPRFGTALRDWVEHGIVSRKVKLLAIGGLSTNFATGAWIAGLSGGALSAWGAVLLAIGAYMATRREGSR